MERFPTRHDVDLRLAGTLVKWKGSIYYCNCTPGTDEPRVNLYDPTNYSNTVVVGLNPNDPELNVNDYTIGYFQYNLDRALFLSRVPLRQQKQGLYRSALYYTSVGSSKHDNLPQSVFQNKGFLSMLIGVYEPVSKSIEVLKKRGAEASRALSEDFAVERTTKGFVLYYRNTLIGDSEDASIWRLAPDYNHSIFAQKLAKLNVMVV